MTAESFFSRLCCKLVKPLSSCMAILPSPVLARVRISLSGSAPVWVVVLTRAETLFQPSLIRVLACLPSFRPISILRKARVRATATKCPGSFSAGLLSESTDFVGVADCGAGAGAAAFGVLIGTAGVSLINGVGLGGNADCGAAGAAGFGAFTGTAGCADCAGGGGAAGFGVLIGAAGVSLMSGVGLAGNGLTGLAGNDGVSSATAGGVDLAACGSGGLVGAGSAGAGVVFRARGFSAGVVDSEDAVLGSAVFFGFGFAAVSSG